MQQQLITLNDKNEFPLVNLQQPLSSFFLLIAAEIDSSPFPFFLSSSNAKKKLIEVTIQWRDQVQSAFPAAKIVVFKGLVIPPGTSPLIKDPSYQFKYARYDLVILIESDEKELIEKILVSDSYKVLNEKIHWSSRSTYVTHAVNVKRISNVDHARPGVFLFNFFQAVDTQQNLDVWHYTAGWFQQKTGLDNSTVLLPRGGDDTYAIVNHCRWDNLMQVLPALVFFRSFRQYVLRHFLANRVAPMPVLYRMV
ncbi:hypothetical protein U0035_00830 [Niabella yanshanensis]|uniref:Uncharacterized protein n=1 Tax=Niabella yanshanensis TaxID=577386 RepID=A0ABZ0W6D5_9BACT|nr:hypothetical protein [Niabella yanshanensis]WQD38686.1 hypothetical protein U0035_00830 [Niabella yanshanensis]